MSLGIDRFLDWTCPVNWQHPYNRGLVARYLCLPGVMGGSRFVSICKPGDRDGLHGTLTNMNPATAWRGSTGRPGGFGCLSFDGGATTRVDLIQTISAITTIGVCAWINLGVVAAVQMIFSNDNSAGSARLFQFRLDADGKLRFIVFSSGSTNGQAVGTTDLRGTGWRFVSGTWDGTTVRVYVDGNQEGTDTAFAGPASNTPGAVPTIGNSFGTNPGTNPCTGFIDDVRLFNRTPSAWDIREVYLDSRLGSPETLNWVGEDVYTVLGRLHRASALTGIAGAGQQCFNPPLSGV